MYYRVNLPVVYVCVCVYIYIYILVMMFKHEKRANTAMPANTAIPIFLTSCETEMHIWKYG